VSPESTAGTLGARILAGPAGVSAQRAVRKIIARQFSTDLDLGPFHQQAVSDLVLSRLVKHFWGMRIPQAATVYETLISAILEQQINLSFAHKVKLALITTYGRQAQFRGQSYNAFPGPAALAGVTPAEFLRLQISGPKARYIIAISRAVLDGSLDLEGLRALDPEQAAARLLKQNGVGPWTAHYVGLRALGHLDCLPSADVGLQKAIQFLYGLRQPPSAAGVEKIARNWKGWRSYATFYIWLTCWEEAAWREELRRDILRARRERMQ
jgi:DNA-3-methyladenine glycosylase II